MTDVEPASDDAIEQGCKCPRIENRKFGRGVTSVDCPIHGGNNE